MSLTKYSFRGQAEYFKSLNFSAGLILHMWFNIHALHLILPPQTVDLDTLKKEKDDVLNGLNPYNLAPSLEQLFEF